MKKIVFYSWQSDLFNGTNRNFIENALKDAAKEIGEESADIEPVIDRDTQGVAGAPNIATAIFQKIDSADIFIADVSIIGSVKKRAIPNPNVLIELGYALKSLGHERIILVFNTAFGKVEKLPFDLRMHRILTYECAGSVTDRSEIKKNLIKDLKLALLAGFAHIAPKKLSISIVDIIKNNAPSKKIELRTHLNGVLQDLEKLQSPMRRDGGAVEELLSAISKTKNISAEFAKLSEIVALMDDLTSAKEILLWFGKILTKYDPMPNGAGKTSNADGDFYKFIGHELFVDFIAPFLMEEKWYDLKEILKISLLISQTLHQQNGGKEDWASLSEFSPLLADESKTRKRLSFHADLLKERHENGELSLTVPARDFLETDFFLYLYGEGKTENNGKYYGKWYPQSVVYLKNTPRFILEAIDYPKAMKICHALAIQDIEELKRRLAFSQIRYDFRNPITTEIINKIGSEGGGKIIYA